jgi:DNA-binding NarL/FixJ family response regulator
MKLTKQISEPIQVAVVDGDPLRFAGFRALLGCHEDLQLTAMSLSEIGVESDIDVVLLGKRPNQNLSQILQQLKETRPDVRVIVTAAGGNDEAVLEALAAGAKGYVDEAAPAADFATAIRIVDQGLIWVSRRVLALFIERFGSTQNRPQNGRQNFTSREKQVLNMLVSGCSNKEIAFPLGIQERTVKAHVAKLLRKVGVHNRIMLSVHAISHALVPMP